jgi:hypothetical protein
MSIDTIARAIRARDHELAEHKALANVKCFGCGASFVFRGHHGDNSGRFCSDRCRENYDAGLPAYDPDYASKLNPRWYSLPIGKEGFLIECRGCGKRFDSRGWAFCSNECKRASRRQQENAAILAEVGMEAPTKRRCCEAPGCLNTIPIWRNGRRVSKAARFCKASCAAKARKPLMGLPAKKSLETSKMCP